MTLPLIRLRRLFVSCAVALSLIAGLVVGGSGASATTAPTQSHIDSVAAQVFNLLNAERALYRLPALHRVAALQRSARAHNIKMAQYNTMSHQLPGELSLGGRITIQGYHWRAVGENVAYNTDWSLAGAYYLQKMMFNEKAPNDGHRRNILSTTYRDVGVDIYLDLRHHKIWLTEDFGRLYGT
ncbi:MAG TPA: CAP domain-containing protein [Jatrophihabitantaceae bacterium]|nr:CAP domain-containing protein [Jatrophihabitantaceae bacterium]